MAGSHLRRNCALSTAALAAVSSAVHAQCKGLWLPGDGIPGVERTVLASTWWDPDGTGPLEPRLVIGGSFLEAGDTLARHIANWDGERWQPLGPGLPDRVTVLTTVGGDLIAGGTGFVRRWNGSDWEPIGPQPASVSAIAEYAGDLYIAASFGAQVNIHRWAPPLWHSIGSPLWTVASMAVHDGNLVAAGGNPARVASWNGLNWQLLGPSELLTTSAAASVGGVLYSTLVFDEFEPTERTIVRRWDGMAWHAVGQPIPGFVQVLAEHEGDLVAAGGSIVFNFPVPPSGFITKWNGSAWTSLVGGVNDYIHTVSPRAGQIAVGGGFTTLGGASRKRIALFDGTSWTDLGTGFDGNINALTHHEGVLYAGGAFTRAGSAPTSRIARWNGLAWEALPAGPDDNVAVMRSHNGRLYAGGAFANAGGLPARNIAAWDGEVWHPLGTGTNTLVAALGSYDGKLVAGGAFTAAGSLTVGGLALWDGEQWSSTGASTGQTSAVAAYGPSLIRAGFNHIQQWNGTSPWSPMASSLSGNIRSLLVFDGGLYAGGSFNNFSGLAAPGIVRWDGAAWSDIGNSGVDVRAMVVYQGQLVAGGSTLNPALSRLSRWDGTAWHPIGPELRGMVLALAVDHDELIVGGSFIRAGSEISAHFARWSATGVPWVAMHPQSQSITVGASTSLEVAAAAGYSNLMYRWHRDGVPLDDGPTPFGSFLSGTATPRLTILGAQIGDAGVYTCTVQNPCGAATSSGAQLSIEPLCYANCDGSVQPPILNIQDFLCFIDRFAEGSALPHMAQLTHYANCDGSIIEPVLNVDDFACFINAFAAGCP
jgi:hypothetical protein